MGVRINGYDPEAAWAESFERAGRTVPEMPTAAPVEVVTTMSKFFQRQVDEMIGKSLDEFVAFVPQIITQPVKKAPVDLFPETIIPIDVREPTVKLVGYDGAGGNLPWTTADASITTVVPLIGTLLVYLGKEVAAQLAISGLNELVQRAKKKYNIRGIKFRYLVGASSVSYTDRGIPQANPNDRYLAVPERIPDKGHMPSWDEFPWWMKPF